MSHATVIPDGRVHSRVYKTDCGDRVIVEAAFPLGFGPYPQTTWHIGVTTKAYGNQWGNAEHAIDHETINSTVYGDSAQSLQNVSQHEYSLEKLY